MRFLTPIIVQVAQSGAEMADPEGAPDTFGLIFAAFVGVFMLSVIMGELFRRKTKQKKPGDDSRSTVFYLAAFVFVVSVLLGIFTKSPIWIFTALPAWLVGFIAQERGERRGRREMAAMRELNARDHSGVFDRDPPQDLDAVPGDTVDVYEEGTCTHIGRFPKSDMAAIVKEYSNLCEHGSNDVFMTIDMLEDEEIRHTMHLGPSATLMLKAAIEDHGDLFLRWMSVKEEHVEEEPGELPDHG